jgi:hypothetical protein
MDPGSLPPEYVWERILSISSSFEMYNFMLQEEGKQALAWMCVMGGSCRGCSSVLCYWMCGWFLKDSSLLCVWGISTGLLEAWIEMLETSSLNRNVMMKNVLIQF